MPEIDEEAPLEAELRAAAISSIDLDEALAGTSIELLRKLLQDRSERMRHVAIDALPLPRRRRAECVTLLADAYRWESSANVRAHLLEAILRVGGEEASRAYTQLTGRRPEQDP